MLSWYNKIKIDMILIAKILKKNLEYRLITIRSSMNIKILRMTKIRNSGQAILTTKCKTSINLHQRAQSENQRLKILTNWFRNH